MSWFTRRPVNSTKSATEPQLARAIDERFGRFLHEHNFVLTPNEITGPNAKWVAVYDGPAIRLVFELDSKNRLAIAARALDNRLRGGALDFLLKFLSGSSNMKLPSVEAQARGLAQHYTEISELLSSRDDVRFREFSQWVEENWTALTEEGA